MHPNLPPFPLSFPHVINTQPQALALQTHLPTSHSYHPKPSSSLPITQNPSSTLQTSSFPAPNFYDPYASLHPSFQKYTSYSLQPPSLPPNPYHHLMLPTLLIHILLNLLNLFSQ